MERKVTCHKILWKCEILIEVKIRGAEKEVAGSNCWRRPKSENRSSVISLGGFAPAGRVTLARVGFHFFRIRILRER